VTFDPVDTYALEVRERRTELVNLGKRQCGVFELPRRAVDLVAMIAELLLDVQGAEAIDADAVDELAANEERRDAEPAEEPLVRSARHEVDAGRANVGGKHAERLYRIGVEQSAMSVCRIRERPHVMPEAVLMRDPCDRHEPSTVVDHSREIVAGDAAVAMFDDPERDSARLLQVPVQHERCVVVQFCDF